MNQIWIVAVVSIGLNGLTPIYDWQPELTVIGWWPTEQEAEAAVRGNVAGMFGEGDYRYAIIERVGPGAYAPAENARWFRASLLDSFGDDDPSIVEIEQAFALVNHPILRWRTR